MSTRLYDNDSLLYTGAMAVWDCYFISNRQEKKQCSENKKTCNKTGCSYYLRNINSCIGIRENERCDDCTVNKIPGLKKYCNKLKKEGKWQKRRRV